MASPLARLRVILDVLLPRLIASDVTISQVETPAPGRTATVPRRSEGERSHTGALEPKTVVLHNDDVNSMDHVVRSLTRSVPNMGIRRAVEIMLEAHNHGRAVVIVCPLELAELVRDRLESCGLTATIE